MTSTGKRVPKHIRTVCRSDSDQVSGGPSGVAAQSTERASAARALPAVAASNQSAVTGSL